jgi:hypothetical protein
MVEGFFSNGSSLTKEIKTALQWNTPALARRTSVASRLASGKGLHTRLGLIGYSLKTIFKEMKDGNEDSDFKFRYKNVTREEFEAGLEEYKKFGNLDKDKVVLLTLNNIHAFAEKWMQFQMHTLHAPFEEVVYDMIKSRKYKFASIFVKEQSAFNYQRNQALWQLNVAPEQADLGDVMLVLYPYSRNLYMRWRHHLPEQPDPTPLMDVDGDKPWDKEGYVVEAGNERVAYRSIRALLDADDAIPSLNIP